MRAKYYGGWVRVRVCGAGGCAPRSLPRNRLGRHRCRLLLLLLLLLLFVHVSRYLLLCARDEEPW